MTDLNRLVWMSYRKDLRWKTAWKRMFELSGFGVFIVQMLTIWPLNMYELEEMALVYYYAISIPLVFSMFSGLCVELRLPKQMYLTPLTQEERREYMEKLLRLKIVFPNMIMAVAIVAVLVFGKLPIAMGMILLLQNVLMTMGLALFYKKEAPNNRKEVYTEGRMIWTVFEMVIGLMGEVIILLTFCGNEMFGEFAWCLWGIGVVVQLFCLYKMYSCKNQYIENLANYERLNVIEEKKEVKSAW